MKIWKRMTEIIELKPGAFLVPAFLLLILPWQWVGAAILAASVHELSHILALMLTNGRIESISIGGTGAEIQTAPMNARQECLCAVAGPLGSAILFLFYRQLPRTALCALVHCLYNLLPLFPLDGGRILRSFLSAVLSPVKAGITELWVRRGTFCIVSAMLLLVTRSFGAAPLLLGICVLLRHRRKNSLPFARFGGTIDPVSTKEYIYDSVAAANSPHCAEACTIHRRRV